MLVPAWLAHHPLQCTLSTGMPTCPPQYLIPSRVTQEANVRTELNPRGGGQGVGQVTNSPGQVLLTYEMEMLSSLTLCCEQLRRQRSLRETTVTDSLPCV